MTYSRRYLDNLVDEYTLLLKKSKDEIWQIIRDRFNSDVDEVEAQTKAYQLIALLKLALGDIPNSIDFKGVSYDKCRQMNKIEIAVYTDIDCTKMTYRKARDILSSELDKAFLKRKAELTEWKAVAWSQLLQKNGLPEFDYSLNFEVPEATKETLDRLCEEHEAASRKSDD